MLMSKNELERRGKEGKGMFCERTAIEAGTVPVERRASPNGHFLSVTTRSDTGVTDVPFDRSTSHPVARRKVRQLNQNYDDVMTTQATNRRFPQVLEVLKNRNNP